MIGAQRAFTSTLSGTVANLISALVVGITMFALSWQVTLLCLLLFPFLLLTSRWVSNRLAGLTREQMDGNADLGNAMTERFNVGGAMLLKLFGRREPRTGCTPPRRPWSATWGCASRCSPGCSSPR